jgi:hypothetical protein
MNRWGLILFTLFAFLIGRPYLYGQLTGQADVSVSLPSMTLIDIEPGTTSFTLSLSSPTESGLPVSIGTVASNNSNWLNYTVAIPPAGNSKNIYVHISSGNNPSGISLNLTASNFSGTGSGTFGNSAGSISLSTSPQALITGIGRSFTGNSINNGHRLTYSLSIVNYAQLSYSESATLQIMYTISD